MLCTVHAAWLRRRRHCWRSSATPPRTFLFTNVGDTIRIVTKRCLPDLSLNGVDDRIASHLAAKILESTSVDARAVPSERAKLRNVAKTMRVALRNSDTTCGLVSGPNYTPRVQLSTLDVDKILADLCLTLASAVCVVLREGGTTPMKLADFISCGELAKLPIIHNTLRHQSWGPVHIMDDSEHFALCGAATYATIKDRHKTKRARIPVWPAIVLNTVSDIEPVGG